MTSGGRELVKWLAVILMTGDHVAKVLYGGYLPVLSEAGRFAFPLFGLVMAYNLAQPGTDVRKSILRLLLWGLIAQPAHALAFGHWLPLNVLLTFSLSAAAIYAFAGRQWVALALALTAMPVFVDYQWHGVGFVLLSWLSFRYHRPWLLAPAFGAICLCNGNLWALGAIPVALVICRAHWPLPRTRWAFYGYYVAHLTLLAAVAAIFA